MEETLKINECLVRMIEAHERACQKRCKELLSGDFGMREVESVYRMICADFNKNSRIAKIYAGEHVVIICNFQSEYDYITKQLRVLGERYYTVHDVGGWMQSDNAPLVVFGKMPESMRGIAKHTHEIVLASLPLLTEVFSEIVDILFPLDCEDTELTYFVQRIGLSRAVAKAIGEGLSFSEMVESETFSKLVGVSREKE